VAGELCEPRKAALPVAAAVGGMLVPAAIYLALQWGQPGARGWGIPMATDIAFVVGCMAFLGRRVPHGLRVVLLSLAIADDIGAILVIAIGYTSGLDTTALLLALGGLTLVVLCGRVGVRSFTVYTVLGVLVWFGFHESGVHATIAGVILGLLTPARSYIGTGPFAHLLERARDLVHGDWEEEPHRPEKVRELQMATRETIPPTEYLQNVLHPWVSFGIMPLFALANAGVPLQADALVSPLALAVLLGLVVGKPAGILLFGFVAVKSGLCRLPNGVGWVQMAGGGCLAGIGFTMAIFIAGLALSGPLLDTAKIGVLVGSFVSAVLGIVALTVAAPSAAKS